MDATLALDWLNENGYCVGVDRFAHRLEITKRQMAETRKKRAEVFFHLLLPGCGDTSHRATVKRACESENSRTTAHTAEAACELDQAFVGLGSTIAEKNLPFACHLHQSLSKAGLWTRAVKIRSVNESGGLFVDSRCDLRMGVAKRANRYSGTKVEEFSTCEIPRMTPLAPLDIEIETTVGGNDKLGVVFGKLTHDLEQEKRAGPLLVPPGPSGDSSGEIFQPVSVKFFWRDAEASRQVLLRLLGFRRCYDGFNHRILDA